MNLGIIIIILITHWVADFVFQTNKDAINKSDDIKSLLAHTFTYSGIWFTLLFIIALTSGVSITPSYIAFISKFTFITFISHTVIDYYTSKVHSVLWKEEKRHEFFISIGFDQLLHLIQLFTTFILLK